MGAFIADAKRPKKNLQEANIASELDLPATNEVALNPITPRASITRLFQFFDYEDMKILEVEYAALNIREATSP